MTEKTFDDVLLRPCWSSIKSRMDVDVSTHFSRNVKLDIPFASANMRTVTDAQTCNALAKVGGIGILHRYFGNEEDWINEICKIDWITTWGLSIGTSTPFEWFETIQYRINNEENNIPGSNVIVIDVANAANDCVFEFTKKVINFFKKHPSYYKPDIVVGNIATAEAAKKYKELDIDGLKVGVGAGATCTTRLMTGVGVPQLAAIRDVVNVLRKSDIKIIADGGISQPGDAVKALSAGADSVMMGKVLAFAKESPGWNFKAPEYGVKQWTKIYKGEASFRPDRTHEGVTHNIILDVGKEPKPVEEILLDYTGGLRSAMSYLNAQNIKHLQENAVFIEVSTNTLIENRTRP